MGGEQTVMVRFQHIPPFLVLIVHPCHMLRNLKAWWQSLLLHDGQQFNHSLIYLSSDIEWTVLRSLFLEKVKYGSNLQTLQWSLQSWGGLNKKKEIQNPETDEKKICFLTHAEISFLFFFPELSLFPFSLIFLLREVSQSHLARHGIHPNLGSTNEKNYKTNHDILNFGLVTLWWANK